MDKEKLKKNITTTVPCLITFGILIYFCVKDNNLVTLINLFPSLKIHYLLFSVLMLVIYWLSDSLIVKELSPNLLCKFSEYFNKRFNN